jgi:putative FmdB family regulatory protein
VPRYDYLCAECGKLFEVRATFAEKATGLQPECPECHAKETHEVITRGMLLHADEAPASSCCGPMPRGSIGCCGS